MKILKITITICAYILLCANVAFTQAGSLIVILEEDMKYAVDMIQISNGNFIIAGNTREFPDRVFVASLNNNGDILWSNYYQGDMLWYAGLSEKANGNILIPMNLGVASLLELSVNGDSVGCIRDLESAYSYFGKALELENGDIVTSEIVIKNTWPSLSTDSCFITLINAEGIIINKQLTNYFELWDMESSGDGNILILSHFYEPGTSIIKSTPLGVEMFVSSCSDYNPRLYNIVKTDDHAFSALGYSSEKNMKAVLSNFDNDGNVEYCSTYNSSYFTSVVKDTLSQKLYVLGNNSDTCFIYTIDNSGSLIGKYFIDYFLDGGSLFMDENYFYISGIYNYSTDPRSCFIRLDKDSVLSVGDVKGPENLIMKIYPNPAYNEIYCQLSRACPERRVNCQLSMFIYDLYGRKQDEIIIPKGQEQTTHDVSNYPTGVYLAILKGDKGVVARGKFVKR